MANIIVVTGSVRPNSVNEKIVPLVTNVLESKGATATVADLKQINLPFFDAPVAPSDPNFAPTNDAAKTWTSLVANADGVVFVMPEYNHTTTPLQQNAIDWIGKEWEHKPVAFVGYGWTTGAAQAEQVARESLAVNLKARVGETTTNLFFMKDLNPDGSIADEAAVNQKIAATIDELLTIVK